MNNNPPLPLKLNYDDSEEEDDLSSPLPTPSSPEFLLEIPATNLNVDNDHSPPYKRSKRTDEKNSHTFLAPWRNMPPVEHSNAPKPIISSAFPVQRHVSSENNINNNPKTKDNKLSSSAPSTHSNTNTKEKPLTTRPETKMSKYKPPRRTFVPSYPPVSSSSQTPQPQETPEENSSGSEEFSIAPFYPPFSSSRSLDMPTLIPPSRKLEPTVPTETTSDSDPSLDPDELLARQLQREESMRRRSDFPQSRPSHHHSHHSHHSHSRRNLTDEQLAQLMQEREYKVARSAPVVFRPPRISPFEQLSSLLGFAPRAPSTPSLNPLNAMLGFINRDFNENDYEMLLQLDEHTQNHRGASKEQLVSLPVEQLKEAQSCCICLEDMEAGTKVKRLPCLHTFHVACIDQWLKVNRICPIDKKSIE